MPNQLSLFHGSEPAKQAPLAAKSDPITSHKAAERYVSSGQHRNDKAAVLEALKRCTRPVSSKELASEAGMDRYMVAKRLPDLLREELVKRELPEGGREMVWWAV